MLRMRVKALTHHPDRQAVTLSRRRLLSVLGVGALGVVSGVRSARATSAPRTVAVGRLLMGTVVEIEANHPDLGRARRAIESGLERMALVDRLMSVFRSESEISHLNRLAGGDPRRVSAHTYRVLTEAQALARQSGGALDVTVLPLMRLWSAAEVRGHLPSGRELDTALSASGADALDLDPSRPMVRLRRAGMGIDLGGIAKGYAIDLAVDALRGHGIESAMVNAGGDLRVLGRDRNRHPWRIGLRHPLDPHALILSIAAAAEAIATSASYFRFFTVDGRRYGHVLDPRTGRPADTALSVTALAPTAMRADGLATAAFVERPDDGLTLLRRPGAEGVVVTRGPGPRGQVIVRVTPALEGRVELLDPTAVLDG